MPLSTRFLAVLLLCLCVPFASGETILHTFPLPNDGLVPQSGLIRDSAGNFYGTTYDGGSQGLGAVYKLDAAGHETVLYSFTGINPDGANPISGVIRDSAGNLYGTTYLGGAYGFGVVYKVDPSNKETILYSFSDGQLFERDGGNPYAGVIRDSAGNLYGTTRFGGSLDTNYGYGVVYKLDPSGNETILYRFTGGADGANPLGGVVQDAAGNLYGTTVAGGDSGVGVVFKLDPSGNETVLWSFFGPGDGSNPNSGVILDGAGNLYGTTFYGGGYASAGVVYKLDSSGNETVLYNFTGGADGGNPVAGVVFGALGTLYGTTYYGGSKNAGVVYKVTQSGTETVLYSFLGVAGAAANPISGVAFDKSGDLYGTSPAGGNTSYCNGAGCGMVYKLTPAGKASVFHQFVGGDGSDPTNGVVSDAAGNLYGTTTYGGFGYGTVYMLDPSGNETILYSFTGGPDGANPYAGLILDPAGNLYGTTAYGGDRGARCLPQLTPVAGCGVVFKLDPSGNETVLHTFVGSGEFIQDGGIPYSGVIRDFAGNLYGTTYAGGNVDLNGTVYKLEPSGNEIVLHYFSGGTDGFYPMGGVALDSAGNVYGTTVLGGNFACGSGCGVVYKLDPQGNLTTLHAFSGSDGANPHSGLIHDSAGNLYGTTYYGGNASQCNGAGCGAIYKLDPKGNETLLYTFCSASGCVDGANPYAGVIRDSAGNLYGTAEAGGSAGAGVVYRYSSANAFGVLYNINGGSDGSAPAAGLILDPSGRLYGTTQANSTNGGVVFRLP